jgi:hypothetical protein
VICRFSGLRAVDDTEGAAVDIHRQIAEIVWLNVVEFNAKLSLTSRDSELLNMLKSQFVAPAHGGNVSPDSASPAPD